MTNTGADPTQLSAEELREAVRGRYAAAARQASEPLDTATSCCGSVQTACLLADLQPGQAVLDLGSGGGLDILLSARRNQREAGVTNAEFLAGTIEDAPLPDATVDVIISNCVISPTA